MFADHWRAKPGADGRKADWLATWRNWVRRERDPPLGRARPGAPPQSFAERDRAAGMERWEQMTGRAHPDRAASPAQASPPGVVIDITPKTVNVASAPHTAALLEFSR